MKAKFLAVMLILSGLFITTTKIYAGCVQYPVAILKVEREYVVLGRSVTLDGSDSYDPDGYITKYEWDFTNNGSYDYHETSSYHPDGAFDGKTTHIYNSTGIYTIKLRVRDNRWNTDTDTYDVNVSPDPDNDSLPSAWENKYDLDPNDFDDGDADLDEDGYNNLSEYLHNTEPNDSNSVPSSNITIAVPADVNSIQRAIDASIDDDAIVVSEGTYYEVIDFNGISCTLTSTDPNDWEVVAATVIDVNDPNACVVVFENSEDANSVLRGFTITGGDVGIYCDGASPTIANCLISENGSGEELGGGMYDCNSSPAVTNCFFVENYADLGGGMYNINSSPTVTNCVFVENLADSNGAGIYNYNSSPIVINCSFSGNYAADDGGGMYNYGVSSQPNITNCIFWGNDANDSGDEIYNYSSADPNFRYCDIEECGSSGGGWDPNFGTDGSGNIDGDPCFADVNDPVGPDGVFGTFDDGLHLRIIQVNSPCVDAADGNTAPSTDITGWIRVDVDDANNTGIGDPNYTDIGAYESPMIWLVDADANSGGNGNSWDEAFNDLQDALTQADDCHEIWVADGNYMPTDGNDRSISFELVEDVAVYGGFAGTELYRSQRDWKQYETILSGDIGTPNDTSDNSFHVVKGANNAILDGFTITEGNADGGDSDNKGGGIYCSGVSPVISNCTITDNNSLSSGAGMYCTNSASPVVTNCTFSGNTAGGAGGGVYNYYNSSPIITNCAFSDNEATYGGGLLNSYRSEPSLTNCVFSSNKASSGGGGIYNSAFCSPTLVNCTFSGNMTTGSGGGMYSRYSSSMPNVTNCIFWGNNADASGDEIYNYDSANPSFGYCDIEGCGGSGGGWDPNFGTDGGGNIDSDPHFADANNPAGPDGIFVTLDDGLRLMANSPCIDAADGDFAPLTDILGLGRLDVNDVNNTGRGEPNYADIGVYESALVKVDKLQYNDPTSGWTDVSGTLYVHKGDSIEFKAIKSPADASWPSGKPVWGGTSGASGTGETKNVTFNTTSSSSTDYKTVTAECDNTTATANVIVCEVEVTDIQFDHDDPASGHNDALHIREDASTEISVPEWVKGGQNKPAAYLIILSNVDIKARFSISPAVSPTTKILATNPTADEILGDISEVSGISFSSGTSGYIRFTADSSTGGYVGREYIDWQWKVKDFGHGSGEININTSGTHKIYTVLSSPVAPQAVPWTKVLDISCAVASGRSNKTAATRDIWYNFYYDAGGSYDPAGVGNYTDDGTDGVFHLGSWIGNYPSIELVNCWDMAKAVVVFANALGCGATNTYVDNFGHLNCIKPIGKGWTNNPFSVQNPIVDGEWGEAQGRSGFGNHAFARRGCDGDIYDASVGRVDVGDDPDDGPPPPHIEWELNGYDTWPYYVGKVRDPSPNDYGSPADPVDYSFPVD